MTANREELNGWPEIAREPVDIERLPPGSPASAVARVAGDALAALAVWCPRVVDALEWLRGRDLAHMGAIAQLRTDIIAEIKAARQPGYGLPPMRPTAASSHDLAKAVGHDVAQAFEAEQRNTSTPPPTGTMVAAMVEQRVQQELQRLRLQAYEKAEADRRAVEAAEAGFALEKRRARLKVWGAALLTLLAIIGACAEHFAR